MNNRRPHTLPFIIAVVLVLVLGVSLIFYGKESEVTVPIHVKLAGLAPQLMIVGNLPVLEACLKGPSNLLKDLKGLQLSHEIDLTSAGAGPLLIKVPPEKIMVPQSVSVLEVNPASFTLRIERRVEKLVPVIPDLNNAPAAGYTASKVVVLPSSIRLTGPESLLEKVSAVRTTPIDLSGLAETIKKKVALNLNHSPYVKPTANTLVEVEVVIEEKTVEKWIDVHVRAKGNNSKYSIKPENIKLLLRGPVNTMNRLAQGDGINVYVDLKGLSPGTYLHPAVIEPPLNTTLVKAKPEKLRITIFK
ncbi:MAG: hypothetical protein DRH10_01670 [Deltaproteobacteria bacterium]|nr:MAG: hypothetical protein DRH10_01670 [Deltaproteobacteria bacterium]RLB94704.1 MAG: hypothetical protein DRH50_06000 [Deltaproteobacteria bacterium]